MDLSKLQQKNETAWEIAPFGAMRVPAIIYATEELMRDMDEKVYQQITQVATLPGIVQAAYAMPDAHWGYGFPIGGVAAFDPEQNGIISAGGVGFDISCGVRLLHTGLKKQDLLPHATHLADALFQHIPAGVGSRSNIRLSIAQMDEMLRGGARWAVENGYGDEADLEYIEENGCMYGAQPGEVSQQAKKRQMPEMGSLGSGNHYLEVQEVTKIYNAHDADVLGLHPGDIVVSIHCGSRGLGHQIGTEFLKQMVVAAPQYGIHLPDRELAAAPIRSPLGESYLGAMRAGINCALANRQIITHFVRNVFTEIFGNTTTLRLIYDVSHNTCKEETHIVDGQSRQLFVHRKGATRAFAPHHPALPARYKPIGQPVIIGGTMGTRSYVLLGSSAKDNFSFHSACHGAGRAMSRHAATKLWSGRTLIDNLAAQGILIRSQSYRGVAEEAPDAYKDVDQVVEAADKAGLTSKLACLKPLVCVKG